MSRKIKNEKMCLICLQKQLMGSRCPVGTFLVVQETLSQPVFFHLAIQSAAIYPQFGGRSLALTQVLF